MAADVCLQSHDKCLLTNMSLLTNCIGAHELCVNGGGRVSAITRQVFTHKHVFTHELYRRSRIVCKYVCFRQTVFTRERHSLTNCVWVYIRRSRRQDHYGKWRRTYVCSHNMYSLMNVCSLTKYVHLCIVYKRVSAHHADKIIAVEWR